MVTFEPAGWRLLVLAQLDAVVVAVGEAGRIVFVHPGDRRLPVVVPASLLGRPVAEVSVSYLPTGGLSMRQIAEVMSGKAERDHVQLRLADGLTHSPSIRRIPRRYRGCSCGILIITTDVTHVADAVAPGLDSDDVPWLPSCRAEHRLGPAHGAHAPPRARPRRIDPGCPRWDDAPGQPRGRVTRIMPSAHARAAENLGVAAGTRPAVPAAASRAETFRIERPPWPDGAARSCYHGRVEAADDLHRRLTRPAYPRSAGYDPHLLIATGMGPNPPWLMEALTQALPLLPGMRVLDLGCCGRAMTTAARDGGGHA